MSAHLRLLMIDDNRDILRAVSLRLKAAGYEAHTQSDSSLALSSALQLLPDAVLLDLRMPAPDGFELLQQFRDCPQLADTPVIVVSANVVEKSRRRALDLGARFFIEKPYQVNTLLRAIAAALGDKQPAGTSNGELAAFSGENHA